MTNSNVAYRCGRSAQLGCVVTVLLIVLIPATGHAQSPELDSQAISAFEAQAHDYVLMHRRLERLVGPIEFGTPVAEINRITQALAAAIRAERGDARQGDFFTPRLGHLLRARIADALIEQHSSANDVRIAGRVDGVDYDRVRLQVNDTFSWRLSVTMFPCVIAALPSLSPELQYRIVGDDLVLIDVHASLVVDILPDALIDVTAPALP